MIITVIICYTKGVLIEGLKRKFHMQENVNSGVNKKRLKIQIPNSLFTVESALSSQASSQALLFLKQTLINRLRIPTGRRYRKRPCISRTFFHKIEAKN